MSTLKMQFTKKRWGFTLIEVLVVIAIIGILIGLSTVAFQAARKAGRDTKRRTDLNEIRSNLEVYRTDCGTYPSSLNFEGSLTGVQTTCSGNIYMSKVPQDPTPNSQGYYYLQSGSNSYQLCAHLEQAPTIPDSCTGSCGGQTCNFKVANP